MNSNNQIKNNLLSNALIQISQTEDEEIDISNNRENSDSDKGKMANKNKYLIYKKSDNKKIMTKKIYADTSNSEVSIQEPSSKNGTNRTLIKKYESKIEQYTNQIEDLKRKLYEEKKSKLDLQEELNYIKYEKEKMSKTNNIQIEKTNEKNISLEEQNKKLIIKIEDLQKNLEENSPKIWKYDEINEKYQKLLNDYKNLSDNNKTLNELLNENKNKKNEIDSDYQSLKLEKQVLQQNNEILKKNLAVSENKIKDLNEKVSELENDIRDMRKINQNYIEKLTDKNLNLDNTYKDKVNKELNDMRSKYESDISNLKKQYDDFFEKKTSYLKEERDEYRGKCNKYEQMIKEKDESLSIAQNELRNINSKTMEQISYLKLQLNSKTEELNSRITINEEQKAALAMLKNDNDALKDKNDLLRSEMIKIQSEYKAEIAEYKIQLSGLTEKLKIYDNMENELDNAINQAPVEGEPGDQEIINIIREMPTSNKRRIDQCLNLANKVRMLSVENEKLKLINDKINQELQTVNDQCNIYKNVADQVKQPNSYLITNLQDKEMEIYKLKQDISDKDQENNKLKMQCESYQEIIKKMENDMKTLVNNRQKIDDLNSILTNYINNENKGFNNYNDVKNLSEYVNNFNSNINGNNLNPFNTQQNFYSNMLNTYNNNNLSLSSSKGFGTVKPERDVNFSGDSTKNITVPMPDWFKKIKEKKNKNKKK
jgi:chromosome segregation ATPase